MTESRCGLLCSECSFRETSGCKGCVNMDKPFWAVTARQCIRLLPMLTKYKPELKDDILSALHKADISIYDDSMQPLVYKDIQKALKEI